MKKEVIVLTLMLLIFVSGCAQQEPSDLNIAPTETEETPTGEEQVNQTTPLLSFPRQDLSLYLGFWMPALQDKGEQSLEDREDLIAIGANTVAFSVGIPYLPTGDVDQEIIEEVKQTSRELMRYYKEAGLAVVFSPEPIPANIEGEPTPVPADARETLLQRYEQVIVDLAKISEEENVEIFSPMNEPDWKLGIERASSWGQDILPKIRQVYTGKVMWKGSSSDDLRTQEIDFSGYDSIGFTSFPWGGIADYKADVDAFITALRKRAEEDGVPEVFAAEFGTYDPVGLSQQDEPKAIEYVFDVGAGKLDGFFVFDPPRGIGTPIKGSELEAVVKEEFEKLS